MISLGDYWFTNEWQQIIYKLHWNRGYWVIYICIHKCSDMISLADYWFTNAWQQIIYKLYWKRGCWVILVRAWCSFKLDKPLRHGGTILLHWLAQGSQFVGKRYLTYRPLISINQLLPLQFDETNVDAINGKRLIYKVFVQILLNFSRCSGHW